MNKLVDLSHDFDRNMPVPDWPGENRQEFELIEYTVTVNSGTQNNLRMNLHCGTHIDAPYHYWKPGISVEKLPLENMMGNCYTIGLHKNALEEITEKDLQPVVGKVTKGEMLFINTGWYKKWPTKEYETSYPYLTLEAGKLITKIGVSVLGLDTPGPDAPIRSGKRHGDPLHLELLSKGVPIIENLDNLDPLNGKKVTVYAFPLRIAGSSGAPSRVVASI